MTVIILEAVENQSAAKLLARKIMANRTDISYVRLLEQLAQGDVEYFYSYASGKDMEFKNALAELDSLAVKYRIVELDGPEHELEVGKMPQASATLKQKPPVEDWMAKARAPAENYMAQSTAPPHEEPPKPAFGETQKITTKPKAAAAGDYLEPYNIEKKHIVKAIITLAVFAAIIFALVRYFPTDRQPNNPNPMPSTRPSRQEAQQRDQALFNNALNDANRACMEGAVDMERLYRVAISFNRNNLRAWHGLLNCFEKRGDFQRVAAIREEMRQIFGGDVFSAASVVSLHGEMETFSAENEVCRITYARNPRAGDPERELYTVAMGVAGSNSCTRAVIFAQESPGVGFMISISLSDLPRSFDEFRRTVTVNKVGQ